MTPIRNSVLDTIGQTPMVKLDRIFDAYKQANIFAKLEFLNPSRPSKLNSWMQQAISSLAYSSSWAAVAKKASFWTAATPT